MGTLAIKVHIIYSDFMHTQKAQKMDIVLLYRYKLHTNPQKFLKTSINKISWIKQANLTACSTTGW